MNSTFCILRGRRISGRGGISVPGPIGWGYHDHPSPTGRPQMPPSELILSVLTPFRTAFTRPTWEKVLVLVTGTILARGRRTVAAALRAAGHEQDPRFSRFHAVFSRDRWSALELARRLLLLLIRAFAPSKAGLSTPWRAATTTSRGSPGS